MNSRWSSKVCSAARVAASRMNSVKDLCATFAARRNTASCSDVVRNPRREDFGAGTDVDMARAGMMLAQSLLCTLNVSTFRHEIRVGQTRQEAAAQVPGLDRSV